MLLNSVLKRSMRNATIPRMFSSSNPGDVIGNISQTIQGVSHINYVEEFDPTLTDEAKKGLKQFLVYRSDPSEPDDEPKLMSYWVNIKECGPMYLDAIIKIKDEMDPTLSFRRYP